MGDYYKNLSWAMAFNLLVNFNFAPLGGAKVRIRFTILRAHW